MNSVAHTSGAALHSRRKYEIDITQSHEDEKRAGHVTIVDSSYLKSTAYPVRVRTKTCPFHRPTDWIAEGEACETLLDFASVIINSFGGLQVVRSDHRFVKSGSRRERQPDGKIYDVYNKEPYDLVVTTALTSDGTWRTTVHCFPIF
jgi:hypothetical protein